MTRKFSPWNAVKTEARMSKNYTDPLWADVPSVLNTQQVRALLGIHINTVKRLIADGELPAYKVGRSYRINKFDLMKFMGLSVEQRQHG